MAFGWKEPEEKQPEVAFIPSLGGAEVLDEGAETGASVFWSGAK